MFKTIAIIVMAALCLNFSANAQENKAIDVTTTGIQIGQKVPDVLIQNIYNYKTADSKSAIAAKLSDFKGKLIILDFWATWCSPCVAMIPKMDSLQQTFKDKVQFISITYQPEKVVLPFLEKLEKRAGKHYNIPVITDDKDLGKLFPYIYLPHYVWIDQDGIVKAITGYAEVNVSNIEKIFNTRDISNVKQKKDITVAYNEDKPLLINGNGGDGSNLKYHSMLTSYIEGIFSGCKIDLKNSAITVTNLPILNLFQIAYGADKYQFNLSKTLLKLKDKSKVVTYLSGDECLDWLRNGNGYNYDLRLPKTTTDSLFLKMQSDLRFLFPQYIPTIQPVSKKCLALTIIAGSILMKSKGGTPMFDYNPSGIKIKNGYLNVLTSLVETKYIRRENLPVVNNTNYLERIDLDLKGNLSDLKELNLALEKYGLTFTEMELPVPTLVLNDR